MKYRTEFDSIGKIKVPVISIGAHLLKDPKNIFNIGDFLVIFNIHSIAIIKKAAAIVQ